MTATPTPLTEPAGGVPPVLTSAAEFADTAQRLADGTGPVAVDTERASGYRYSQRAYLIQLKRAGAGSFLLDPTHEPGALSPADRGADRTRVGAPCRRPGPAVSA